MTIINRFIFSGKNYSTAAFQKIINGKTFEIDSYTNLVSSVVSCLNKNLYNQKEHPLCLIKERIINFFNNKFTNKNGNPIFSIFDDLSPIVTVYQNFDSLLVRKDHPSRSKSDCYYINKEWMLRAHMTAHQSDLIKTGLNNFLMIGDVYRRDHVDSTHYPAFHQLDGVRLFTPEELFAKEEDEIVEFKIKRDGNAQRTELLQEAYTSKAAKIVEAELKRTIEDLSRDIFGSNIKYKWVEAYFPFTHPSWELEILLKDTWVELLGCGIVEHKILENAGFSNKIGWAFGLGLERIAMAYYSIPDIRIFWSKDSGFLHQFSGKSWADKVIFKPFSQYPPCPFDLSFWINDTFEQNDFFELVREHCGEIIEQIQLIDVYKNSKTGKQSRCYRLVYRSMEKTFTKMELTYIHKELEKKVKVKFNVEIR